MKITSITIDGNEVKNFVRGKYQLTVQSRDDFYVLQNNYSSISLKLRDDASLPGIEGNDFVVFYSGVNIVFTGYIDPYGHRWDAKSKLHTYRVQSEQQYCNNIFGTLTATYSNATIKTLLDAVVAKLPGYSWSAPQIGAPQYDVRLNSIHHAQYFSVDENHIYDDTRFYVDANPWYYDYTNLRYLLKVWHKAPGDSAHVQKWVAVSGAGVTPNSPLQFVAPGTTGALIPANQDVPLVGSTPVANGADGSRIYLDTYNGKTIVCRWHTGGEGWYTFAGAIDIEVDALDLNTILADVAYICDAIVEVKNKVITFRNNTNVTSHSLNDQAVIKRSYNEYELDDDRSDYEMGIAFPDSDNDFRFRRRSLDYYYDYKYQADATRRIKWKNSVQNLTTVTRVGDMLTIDGIDYGTIVSLRYPINDGTVVDIESEVFVNA